MNPFQSRKSKIEVEFQRVAETLSLTLTNTGSFLNAYHFLLWKPMLSGFYKGKQLHILRETGKNKNEGIRIKIQIKFNNPDNFKLFIRRELLGDGILKFLGMQDIQFNNKRFDNNFVIKSSDEAFAKFCLNSNLQDHFLRDMGLISEFRLGKNSFWANLFDKRTQNRSFSSDILDMEMTGNENKKVSVTDEGTSSQFLTTYLLHDLDGEMKGNWCVRLVELGCALVDRVEGFYLGE